MTIKIAGKEVDAIIFDLEKTLYPPEEADRIFATARRQLAEVLLTRPKSLVGLPQGIVDKKIKELTVLADHVGWSKAYLQLGGNIDFYHRTVRGINRSNGLKFNQELHQLLNSLKAKVKLGLFTKATIPIAEAICAKILGKNWQDLFHAFVCDGTPGCPAEKPDPRAFKFILELLGVTAERAAMIGDSLPDDIVPASNLGMLTIFVGDQEGIGDFRISRIEELSTLIDTTCRLIYSKKARPFLTGFDSVK